MMGGPRRTSPATSGSPLRVGVGYDPQKVVGDSENAQQVQLQDGSLARYPVWLACSTQTSTQARRHSDLLPPVHRGGKSLAKPGRMSPSRPSCRVRKGGRDRCRDAPVCPADQISRQLDLGQEDHRGLVTGKFTTAFPTTRRRSRNPRPHPTMIVVADTDWLFDDYSVQKVNFLGQTAAKPINDNLAFAANSLDFLSGSSDLISIRGKGNSLRPFIVVERMEARQREV